MSETIELIFEDHFDTSNVFMQQFVLEGINNWLQDEGIQAKQEVMHGHKATSYNTDPEMDGGVISEAYTMGQRYRFDKSEDAVLFKFRWFIDISEDDEYVKQAEQHFFDHFNKQLKHQEK